MKKSIGTVSVIICILFLVGCNGIDISSLSDKDLERISNKAIVCNDPYIRVGTECCLDKDSNSICDVDETESKSDVKETVTETKAVVKTETKKGKEPTINPTTCVNLQIEYKTKESYNVREPYTEREPYQEEETYTETESVEVDFDTVMLDPMSYPSCCSTNSLGDFDCSSPCYVDKEVEKTKTITKYRDVTKYKTVTKQREIEKTKTRKLCGEEILDYCELTSLGDISCPICEETALGDISCPAK